ncbi:hypothetical protein N7465_001158 [Penicillium sp. CMV-2018d]|nr:hypothetical protein N7465_001158 [Penicillium sp. CMV-2018d]
MIDDHYQKTALGIVVAFTILSDDYVIVVGYLRIYHRSLSICYFVVLPGLNISLLHSSHRRPERLTRTKQWNFANQLLHSPALTVVKLSILLFLRRLHSRSQVVKYLIWSSFAIVTSLCTTVILVEIFQCNPVAYVYDTTIPGGKCINQGAFYVSTAALTLFTDIMVL